MRILIVEDEKRLADTLAEIVAAHRHEADIAYDGEQGFDDALSGIYDAVILDVMLPKMDGFTLVRALRRENVDTPVLMLTARAETESKVLGLDSGADYYLTKPFSADELLACLRAISRRRGEVLLDGINFGDLELSFSSYELSCGARSLRLSKKEFEVLRLLLVNSGRVIAKETLLLKLWGTESEAEYNNVEVYISFLRKKLQYLGSRVVITTIRKLGYQIEDKTDDR